MKRQRADQDEVKHVWSAGPHGVQRVPEGLQATGLHCVGDGTAFKTQRRHGHRNRTRRRKPAIPFTDADLITRPPNDYPSAVRTISMTVALLGLKSRFVPCTMTTRCLKALGNALNSVRSGTPNVFSCSNGCPWLPYIHTYLSLIHI